MPPAGILLTRQAARRSDPPRSHPAAGRYRVGFALFPARFSARTANLPPAVLANPLAKPIRQPSEITMVRAKFKLSRIEITEHTRQKVNADGYEAVEMRTLI